MSPCVPLYLSPVCLCLSGQYSTSCHSSDFFQKITMISVDLNISSHLIVNTLYTCDKTTTADQESTTGIMLFASATLSAKES